MGGSVTTTQTDGTVKLATHVAPSTAEVIRELAASERRSVSGQLEALVNEALAARDIDGVADGIARGWPSMTESGRRTGDEALTAALLSGATIAAAAETARIGERTARRRLRDPDFVRRLNEERRQLLAAVAAQIAGAADRARATLVDLLDADIPPAVRRAAANDLLKLAPEHGEMADAAALVADRLDRI
jgi:hypothetical protein